MKLESVGILINLRPLGERDSIGQFFTMDFGIMSGVLRAAQIAKKNRPLIGQMGPLSWNARLDSQLGVFHFESVKNLAAPLMMDSKKILILNSIFSLTGTMLPERAQYTDLFLQTEKTLGTMAQESANLLDIYLAWELDFLRHLGYAFNLTKCSGCGTLDNLNYLSPRSARAVCETCATPYISRLYKLPITTDIMKIFIEMACDSQGIKLPLARKMLSITF